MTCGAQLLQGDHGQEEVLVIQEGVECRPVGLLDSAVQAVCPCEELVEATYM